jgi:hypothetical protein
MEAILDFFSAAKQGFGDVSIIGVTLFIDTV